MGRSADKPLWQGLNQRSHEEGSLFLAEKQQRQQKAARAPEQVVGSSSESGNLNLIPAHRPSNEARDTASPTSSQASPWGFAPLGEPAALLQG